MIFNKIYLDVKEMLKADQKITPNLIIINTRFEEII